jgi:hypothetical protein
MTIWGCGSIRSRGRSRSGLTLTLGRQFIYRDYFLFPGFMSKPNGWLSFYFYSVIDFNVASEAFLLAI